MRKRLGLIVLVGLLGGLTGCSSGGDDGGSAAVTSVCDATHLSLCTIESTCVSVSGNWYDDSCNSDPSSSWNQMEWDKGQWK